MDIHEIIRKLVNKKAINELGHQKLVHLEEFLQSPTTMHLLHREVTISVRTAIRAQQTTESTGKVPKINIPLSPNYFRKMGKDIVDDDGNRALSAAKMKTKGG